MGKILLRGDYVPYEKVLETGPFLFAKKEIQWDMKPRKIKQNELRSIDIEFDDGKSFRIPLKMLRDECPCAECKGETVLFQSHPPSPDAKMERPGKYDIQKIELVGTYGMQPQWGDGHATGIYPWEYVYRMGVAASAME